MGAAGTGRLENFGLVPRLDVRGVADGGYSGPGNGSRTTGRKRDQSRRDVRSCSNIERGNSVARFTTAASDSSTRIGTVS